MNPGRADRTEPTRDFGDRAAESDRYRDVVADDLIEERGSSAGHSAQWPPFVADAVRDYDGTCQPEPGAQLLLQGHEEAQVSEDGDLHQPALAGLLEQPGDLDPGKAESGRDFLMSQVELVVKPGRPGHQVVLTHHVQSLPVWGAGLGVCDAGNRRHPGRLGSYGCFVTLSGPSCWVTRLDSFASSVFIFAFGFCAKSPVTVLSARA